MPFQQEQNVTKDTIGDFEIILFVPGPNNTENPQDGRLNVQIGLSDGRVQGVIYDLLAHLQDDPAGQAHLANLVALRDYIRTRLENEVLP
jgi:hypothetical protein